MRTLSIDGLPTEQVRTPQARERRAHPALSYAAGRSGGGHRHAELRVLDANGEGRSTPEALERRYDGAGELRENIFELTYAGAWRDGTSGLSQNGASLHGDFFGQSSFATHRWRTRGTRSGSATTSRST